jgi:hypothetical protein
MKNITRLFGAIIIVSALFFNGIYHKASAQEPWSGLDKPQTILPKGNAPFQISTRVPFKDIKTRLVKTTDNADPYFGEWIISDGWILIDGEDKFNATVPGTVLTTFIDQGVYPDPYYGLNNMSIPDSLSEKDWWYEVNFTLPQELHKSLSSKRFYLTFNGINYRSEVLLNGHKIGDMTGAFKRGIFDVTDIIGSEAEASPNYSLRVHILPLYHPGIPHEQSISEGQGLNGGATSLDGPTFISSVGWDWVPGIRDRNVGIWQDVRLSVGGAVRICDPLIVTDLPLPDTTSASLTIESEIRNDGTQAERGIIKAIIIKPSCCDRDRCDHIELKLPFELMPGEIKNMVFSPETHPELLLKNPELWWPNGYGGQPLYKLQLSTICEGAVSDEKKLDFGIREMSYELMAHSAKDGAIRVQWSPVDRYSSCGNISSALHDNAQSIFPSSGKKLPPMFDNINKVLYSKEKNLYISSFASYADCLSVDRGEMAGLKLLPSIDPVRENFIIKVNGVRIFCRGGDWGMDDALKRDSRENLEKYIALHRDMNFNIIRNWTGETTQESLYSLCDRYGMLVWNDFWMTGEDTVGPIDLKLFLENAEDVVRRFRCHPSIAIWCPRNEGFAPVELEKELAEMTATEDPTRHYHGQSRFLNMGTSGPWNYFEDPSLYFSQRADGFNTEMGSYAVPTASTLRKFIAPEDRWPINDVWAYHDLHHTTQNFDGFMKAVEKVKEGVAFGNGTVSTLAQAETLVEAETLAQADKMMELFADAAQPVCYHAWRSMIESWNSRMWNNTTGLILWMSHPAWPSMIWQTYTYDFQTPGSFFGAKKGCEPLHIQYNLDTKSICIINSTKKEARNLKATATCHDHISGKELISAKWKGNAGANSLTLCLDSAFMTDALQTLPEKFLLRLTLSDDRDNIVSVNDYYVGGYTMSGRDLSLKPKIVFKGKSERNTHHFKIKVKNNSHNIIPFIKLNVIEKETAMEILPAHFSDGYFNLLPSEERVIECDVFYEGKCEDLIIR